MSLGLNFWHTGSREEVRVGGENVWGTSRESQIRFLDIKLSNIEAFNEDIFYMWRFQKSVILCIQIETPVGSMVFSFRGGRDEYPIPSKVRVTSLFILITSTDWWTEKSVGWQRTTCFKPSSKLSPGFIFWRVCHMPCPETSNGFPWLAEFGQNSEAWPWRPFP